MSLYVFHVPEQQPFVDYKTMDLPDSVAARREAVLHLAALLKERPTLPGLGDTIRLQVHDSAERCLFVVNVQIIDVTHGD